MAILIFDIGKTNKKALVFNEDYQILWEESIQFKEIQYRDFPTENLPELVHWLLAIVEKLFQKFSIKAINFSAYGASGIALDTEGKVLGNLVNYLCPAEPNIAIEFWTILGNQKMVEKASCSPWMGNLNTGYQWFERLKLENLSKLAHFLHFPNYLSYLFHGQALAEMTSLGCHTLLWNFTQNNYMSWVETTGLNRFFPEIKSGYEVLEGNKSIKIGMGLHDSSAALIPYLNQFSQPFILISTGTWCIAMNPFNSEPLSDEELKNDVLCYLTPDGKPIKSSRVFAGKEHEEVVQEMINYFQLSPEFFYSLPISSDLKIRFHQKLAQEKLKNRDFQFLQKSDFKNKKLTDFSSAQEAYEEFIMDLMIQQIYSLSFVFDEKKDFLLLVDGGFSKNKLYMNCLKWAFPNHFVAGAEIGQASAFGAALAIHSAWNTQEKPQNLINIREIK